MQFCVLLSYLFGPHFHFISHHHPTICCLFESLTIFLGKIFEHIPIRHVNNWMN